LPNSVLFPTNVLALFSLGGRPSASGRCSEPVDVSISVPLHPPARTVRRKKKCDRLESLPLFDFPRAHWCIHPEKITSRRFYFVTEDNPEVDCIEITKSDTFFRILVQIAKKVGCDDFTVCLDRNDSNETNICAPGCIPRTQENAVYQMHR
jgi:hypothetical protein